MMYNGLVSLAGTNNRPSELKAWALPVGLARRHFANDPHIVPKNATTLDEFLTELKPALDMHQLIFRPVDLIFNTTHYNVDVPHPACSGLWMEFGVFNGGTVNKTAEFRERFCGVDSGNIYGFDTFTGLPEDWSGGFGTGAFSLGGNLPPVRSNIELVKGLFSDSLPPWIQKQKKMRGGSLPAVTYLHIDCDLYAGSRDALTILKEYIAPGCVLIFDELLHYAEYKQHEVKALWEYLQSSGRQVSVVGVMGPMSPHHDAEAVDLSGYEAHQQESWMYQSVAFIVL